jgi:ribonuclease HI
LEQQASRDTQLLWGDISAVLYSDKFVHVITDGGAKLNPGSAIIRQNGRFAWNYRHCSRATNNAMELRAVIEALRNLPNDMHVWVSTDSEYVKKGIIEWLPNWIKNGWRNAQGQSVANQTLWQALITQVARMRKVEWTWVRGHNGYLLNECADILATKGVINVIPFSNVQYLHPINEHVDFETYTFQDGELPEMGNDWKGDERPKMIYVMQSEENHAIFLSSTTGPDTTPWPSAPPSAQVLAPVTDVPSDDDESDVTTDVPSDSWPQPADSGDEGRFVGGFPAKAAESEPFILAKPSWWTGPWHLLEEESSPRNALLAYEAMCPA